MWIALVIATIIAILGIIYFYKTIDSTSAIVYGIYASIIIILYVSAYLIV